MGTAQFTTRHLNSRSELTLFVSLKNGTVDVTVKRSRLDVGNLLKIRVIIDEVGCRHSISPLALGQESCARLQYTCQWPSSRHATEDVPCVSEWVDHQALRGAVSGPSGPPGSRGGHLRPPGTTRSQGGNIELRYEMGRTREMTTCAFSASLSTSAVSL